LAVIATQWGRIGCIGFGGPPTHIALLRALCVQKRGWLTATEFEDGIAATNLLPGPASTQLAIWCAWRLRGIRGAILGGLCFIVPGLIIILGLAALFLSTHPPLWVSGAAAGAAAAVPAVAAHAATGLIPASWKRAGPATYARIRWTLYLLAGGTAAAMTGPWVVLVLVGRAPGRGVDSDGHRLAGGLGGDLEPVSGLGRGRLDGGGSSRQHDAGGESERGEGDQQAAQVASEPMHDGGPPFAGWAVRPGGSSSRAPWITNRPEGALGSGPLPSRQDVPWPDRPTASPRRATPTGPAPSRPPRTPRRARDPPGRAVGTIGRRPR